MTLRLKTLQPQRSVSQESLTSLCRNPSKNTEKRFFLQRSYKELSQDLPMTVQKNFDRQMSLTFLSRPIG